MRVSTGGDEIPGDWQPHRCAENDVMIDDGRIDDALAYWWWRPPKRTRETR